MHYRVLGRTGLRISVIVIGTWQFGGEWGKDFTTIIPGCKSPEQVRDNAAAAELVSAAAG
jgi:aryl-alcohol dehydrogenase-like predicted oxidoreductase